MWTGNRNPEGHTSAFAHNQELGSAGRQGAWDFGRSGAGTRREGNTTQERRRGTTVRRRERQNKLGDDPIAANGSKRRDKRLEAIIPLHGDRWTCPERHAGCRRGAAPAQKCWSMTSGALRGAMGSRERAAPKSCLTITFRFIRASRAVEAAKRCFRFRSTDASSPRKPGVEERDAGRAFQKRESAPYEAHSWATAASRFR
jgi:hypothetical protein